MLASMSFDMMLPGLSGSATRSREPGPGVPGSTYPPLNHSPLRGASPSRSPTPELSTSNVRCRRSSRSMALRRTTRARSDAGGMRRTEYLLTSPAAERGPEPGIELVARECAQLLPKRVDILLRGARQPAEQIAHPS